LPYQLAYDVLEDGYRVGFAWVGVPLGVLILLVAFLRRGKAGPRVTWPQSALAHPPVGVLVGGLLVALFAGVVGVTLWDQHAARRQAQHGDCPTVEGEVANYSRANNHTKFTVNGVHFHYHRRSAGFRGRYTNPAVQSRLIKDGLRVRIVYCDDNILRIEYVPQ